MPGLTARAFSRWSREIYLNFPEAARVLTAHHADLIDTGAPIEPPPDPRPDARAARARGDFRRRAAACCSSMAAVRDRCAMNRSSPNGSSAGCPRPAPHLGDGAGDLRRIRVAARAVTCACATTCRRSPTRTPRPTSHSARAGAMTTAELFAWAIPAVVVPLPTAAADHQTTQRTRRSDAPAPAIHVPQSELTVERLDREVRTLLSDPAAMARLAAGASARARPDAAEPVHGESSACSTSSSFALESHLRGGLCAPPT